VQLTVTHFIFAIQDFEAIGIDKRGFQLKLEKEVKKLDTPEIQTSVPVCDML